MKIVGNRNCWIHSTYSTYRCGAALTLWSCRACTWATPLRHRAAHLTISHTPPSLWRWEEEIALAHTHTYEPEMIGEKRCRKRIVKFPWATDILLAIRLNSSNLENHNKKKNIPCSNGAGEWLLPWGWNKNIIHVTFAFVQRKKKCWLLFYGVGMYQMVIFSLFLPCSCLPTRKK